jgi:type IV secretion system protein VirD4
MAAGVVGFLIIIWPGLKPETASDFGLELISTRRISLLPGFLAYAIEIGRIWHLGLWRLRSFAWIQIGAVLWAALTLFSVVIAAGATLSVAHWAGWPVNTVDLQDVSFNVIPTLSLQQNLILIVAAAPLPIALLALRIWTVQREEHGLGFWQLAGEAIRGTGSFFVGAQSRARALFGALIGIGITLWLAWWLIHHTPFDWLAPITSMFDPKTQSEIGLGLKVAYGLFVLWFIRMAFRGLGDVFSALRGTPELATDTHGQARTALESELRRAKLSPHRQGIYLGRFFNRFQPNKNGDAIEYPGTVHLVTLGRTGIGKGTGLIIPNLSALRRSILVIDPKGEAAAITARKRAQFGRVVILNPFNLLVEDRPWMRSHGFNPLSTVRTDENFLDDCTIIGQSLVKQEKSGNGRFFSGSAHDLVTALVMHEKILRRENANIANVRAMLTEPFEADPATGYPTGLARTIFDMTQSRYEPLRAKAGRFKSASNSTRDIISTAANETAFLDSPPVARDLASTNDFRFADLKSEVVTVYLILPATHLETHANWLRLIVASALRELLATPANPKTPPVLFMLDEFSQLGYLPAISNAMNIARAYGVQLWPFVQDLTQLKDIYHDNWENFLGASAALTAFAPRELFTSDYLSKLCGGKTIIVENQNERGLSGEWGRGRGPQNAPLFRPEELRAMPAGQMLCFVEPVKQPFMARALGYWETEFNSGLDSNPYFQS